MANMRLTMLIALALSLGGCRDPEHSPPPTGRPDAIATGCNVLLITMDTTRADRLGCYGRERAATPALDTLARTGVRFDQAFSAVPITLPAHTALLTGTYPPENGVRNNARYALGPELPTLPEILQQHGYRTGAFMASRVLAARYGLNRGFELYDDSMSGWERPANEVCDKALGWLSQVEAKPFFCWVHLFDPHAPYEPPPPYAERVADPYDGEIAFMDANIGRLLAWLDEHNLRSKTLVVAVADHGESLGEHGYDWHSLLVYDAMMRVPLILSLPGRIPEQTTCNDVVRGVDVMPTILDLLGWDAPPEVSGESLLAALRGERLSPRQSYGESEYAYEGFCWSKLRCLIEGRWKYIRAPQVELYDRIADPGELNNLAQAQPGLTARLEDELSACEQRMRTISSTPLAVDAQGVQVLRGLGYVGAPPPTVEPGESLPNPRDMVQIVQDQRLAETLLGAGGAREAIDLMEPARQRSPRSFVIVELLAKAYAAAGWYELAQLTLQDALAIYSESPEAWYSLTRVLAARGAPGRALQACERTLSLDPDHEGARTTLPKLRGLAARHQAAIRGLREQSRAHPDDAPIALALSDALALAGETDQAIDVLKAALSRHPQDPELATRLAWRLATTPRDNLRNGAEALRLAKLACEASKTPPPDRLDALAAAMAETGDYDGATSTARRAADLAQTAGDTQLAASIARRAAQYESKHPYRAAE